MDKSLLSQKKEQSYSRHTIQSKLTRLYFEELSKVHATPDSVLVCIFLRFICNQIICFLSKINQIDKKSYVKAYIKYVTYIVEFINKSIIIFNF